MITDGTYYCGRCGEDQVYCSLCVDEPTFLVKRNLPSYNDILKEQRELDQISASIREGAEMRRRER